MARRFGLLLSLGGLLGGCDDPPDYCGGCPTGSTCRRGVSEKIGVSKYECVMVVKTVEVPLSIETTE